VSTLGVITGLKFEAEILRKAAKRKKTILPMIASVAGNQQRAYDIACGFAGQGARGLISFGIAGGLSHEAPVGTLILPNLVICEKGSEYHPDKIWRNAYLGRLPLMMAPATGPLISLPIALELEMHKRKANQETGALGVDMESFGVAKAAKDCGIPFIVVRAISDSVTDTLPASLVPAMTEDGSISAGALLKGIIKNPSDLVHLPAFGVKTSRANRTLRRAAFLGLPLFGLRL
jgi:hypothetical protein